MSSFYMDEGKRERLKKKITIMPQNEVDKIQCEVQKMFLGHKKQVSYVEYFSPNRLVSLETQTLRFWDVEKAECVKVIDLNDTDVSMATMLKFNDENMITNGVGKTIYSYNVISFEVTEFQYPTIEEALNAFTANSDQVAYTFLKTSSDNFVASFKSNKMMLFSFSEKRVIKEMSEAGDVTTNSHMCMSKKEPPEGFFFNVHPEIKLLDTETLEIIRTFDHKNKPSIYAINTFVRHDTGSEYLLVGGLNEMLFVYDAATTNLLQKLELKFAVWCMNVFANEYILSGGHQGIVELIHIPINSSYAHITEKEDNNEQERVYIERISEYTIHTKESLGKAQSYGIFCGINNMVSRRLLGGGGDNGGRLMSVEVVTCSSDESVKLSKIACLPVSRSLSLLEEKDLEERREYVVDVLFREGYEVFDFKKMLVEFRLNDIHFCNVSRSLLFQ